MTSARASADPHGADHRPLSQVGIYLTIAAITFLWGINWPAMKMAVDQMSPWLFRVISVSSAGVILVSIARSRGEVLRVPRSRVVPLVLVSIFGVSGWHVLTALGLQFMGGGRASIIAFTMPVWASLLGIAFLGERPSSRHFLGLLSGMGGIALLISSDITTFLEAPIGMLLMLSAAIVWGGQTVALKAFDWQIGVIALTGWQLLLGSVPITIAWIMLEGGTADFSGMDWRGAVALAYVVFVALVFCFTSYIRLVRHLPATVAAISTLAMPVVGVSSSALLLNEHVGYAEVAALSLTLLAMSLVLLPRR